MLRKAESVWPLLNGIISIYKPPAVSVYYVGHKLKNSLCKDLNNFETRPPDPYMEVNRTCGNISLKVRPSYADNVLCTGPRYQTRDIFIHYASPLTAFMSGVMIVGINRGLEIIRAVTKCNFSKCFHIKGVLGQATSDFKIDGKVLARAKFNHIKQYHLERILVSYQSASQRRIFDEYNIDMTSQEGYKFAIKGVHRPEGSEAPIVYNMKIVNFEPPNFTIEVQCINMTEDYLKNLIHNLGVSLKCFAACAGIRCIRHGCFQVQDSLLVKHWNVDNVVVNMKQCFSKLEDHFPSTIGHTPTVTVEQSAKSFKKS